MKDYNEIHITKQRVSAMIDEAYSKGYDKAYEDRKIEEEFDEDRAKAIEEAYQKGLNDAWEGAKKIALAASDGGFSIAQLRIIFDEGFVADIVAKYSASEAIAKIKEYEEKKNAEDEEMYRNFEVGDIVEHTASGNTFRAIVTCVSRNELGATDISLMYRDGSLSEQHVGDTPWRKTGKRVDAYLKAALEQVDQ